jgi:hypothetical protein
MRGRAAFSIVVAIAALVVGLVVGTRLTVPPQLAHTAKRTMYQCSMHPQIVSDKPGICPICQMRLVPIDDAGGGTAPPTAAAARKPLFYRHPMRPDVTSPVPAKDEMGMDYVPVYEDEDAGGAGAIPGHASFTLPVERQQLIGVTRDTVHRRALETDIRAVGKVAYDPQLYQAMVEYREALRARAQVQHSPWAGAQEGAAALLRGAALKLRQQGLSEAQLAAMAKAAPDPENLLLPGKTVWVYAQVYESELDLVRPGAPLTITAAALPGRTFSASVAAVDPILNVTTRTARVRALVATPDADLRPETFVQVRIHVALGEALAVPKVAVLDTGERQIVFVVHDQGTFEPRAVSLGRDAGEYAEVLSGLEDGEEVVTSANFLIDSESRFRAALAAFKRPPAEGR